MTQEFRYKGMIFVLDISADQTDGDMYEPPSFHYWIERVTEIFNPYESNYPDQDAIEVSKEFSDFLLENEDFWEKAQQDFLGGN